MKKDPYMGAIIGNYDMKDKCELFYILAEKKTSKMSSHFIQRVSWKREMVANNSLFS